MTVEILEDLGREMRNACRERGPLDQEREPQVFQAYLASVFDYDVRFGGFGQLLYNCRGNYLREIEDLLITVRAKRAQAYYVRAIRACDADGDAYSAFMAGEYAAPSTFKDDLLLISIEYLRGTPSFVEEARPGLEILIAAARRWLSR